MKHLTRCVSKIEKKPSIPAELVIINDNNKPDLPKTNITNCTSTKNLNMYKIEIPGKINNYEINFLIDTGASITVINNNSIYLNEIVPLETDISLEAANNTSLNIVGKSLVEIKIGTIEIKHECIIVEGICSPILLGMDVLTKLKVIVNLDNNNIVFKLKKQSETFKWDVNNSFKVTQLSSEQKFQKNENNQKIDSLDLIQLDSFSNYKNENNNEQYIKEFVKRFTKGPQVPGDGDCGAHALRICLKNLGFSLSSLNILKLIGIEQCQSGYYLTDEDLAFICDTLNKNLIIINENYTTKNEIINSALVYWTPHRQTVCVFHEKNHWRPGILTTNSNLSVHNICICYEFPKIPSVKNNTTNRMPHELRKYFCADCNELLINLEGLKLHNLQNHKYDLNFPVINCNDCNIVMLGYNANMDLHCKGEIHIKNIKAKDIDINKSNKSNITDNITVQINSEIAQSPITWYSHFCDECEHLSLTESALKNHELQHHPFWSKGGDVMFCQICGSYIREYKNTLQLKNTSNIKHIGSLKERHLISKFHMTNLNMRKNKSNISQLMHIHIRVNDTVNIQEAGQFNIKNDDIEKETTNNVNKKLKLKTDTKQNDDPLTSISCLFENIVNNNMNEPVLVNSDDIANFNSSSVNSVDSHKSNKIISRHIYHNTPATKRNILNFDINSELPENHQHQLRNLLESYGDCFAQSPMDLGSIDIGDVPIPTMSDDPVSLPPYRLSLNEQRELQRQVDELLQAGLIIPSNSSYASPAFLVNKADGSKRLVIDYRQLNKIIPHQNFPITHMQTVFDCLEGTKFFNIMDMQQGFLNILLGKTDRHKLAFITPCGLYEWTRFPFGYKNSPRQFSKAVAKALSGLLYLGTINYVDDIINYATNFDDLLKVLEKLLIRIRETGFKLKASKCKFGYFELKILGQIVNRDGIKPNPSGLDAIRKFPIPKTIKQVRSFLGLSNFFRKFIPRFAELSTPLTNLTRGSYPKKSSPVKWLEEHQKAFEEIKNKLTNPPLLKHFNPSLKIVVWTDASKIGIAGTLLQKSSEDEYLHPVSYISRRLNQCEEKYSAIELELLAIVYVMEQFRTYTYGESVEIWTDHAPLKYLDNIKTFSVRIQRLKSKLVDFDYTIKYRKGLLNQVCDAMSRNPVFDPPTLEQEVQKDNDLTISHVKTINMQVEQNNDPMLNKIIQALENPEISDHIWIRKSKKYFLNQDKILMYKHETNEQIINLIAIPEKRINEILYNFHDHPFAGHLGIDKTYKKIMERYFWPTIYKDVRKYVLSCLSCQKRKADKTPTYGHMQTSPKISGRPFERFTIDFVGPISPSSNGCSYILVGTCATTKYAIAKPYKKADGKTTVNFLIDIISQYGAISEIHSDRGLHFTNNLVKDLLTTLNIKNTFSIAYRPQSQGQTEKFNGTLIDMISHFVQEKPQKWSQIIKYVLFGYNSSKNETTGYSPFFLLHAYHPKSIFDFNIVETNVQPDILIEIDKINDVRNKLPTILEKQFLKNKQYYDKNKNEVQFLTNEKVLVKTFKNNNKFSFRYDGPYKIIKKISDNTYLVEVIRNGQLENVYKHVSQIKKFRERIT